MNAHAHVVYFIYSIDKAIASPEQDEKTCERARAFAGASTSSNKHFRCMLPSQTGRRRKEDTWFPLRLDGRCKHAHQLV